MLIKWLNRLACAGILGASLLVTGAPHRADAQPIPVSLIEVRERTETRALPAPVQMMPKSGLAPGETKVVSEGKEGQEVVVFTQTYVNGKLFSEKIKSVSRTEPSPKVVEVGSRSRGSQTSRSLPRSGRTLRTAGEAAARRTSSEKLAAIGFAPERQALAPAQIACASHLGWSLDGGKTTSMTATAYVGGTGGSNPRTATGRAARRGMIAVDPRVIPLHSILYVEGYGWGVAADTGGAIKGSIIDVCVDDSSDARQWGRRKVKVIVFPQKLTTDRP